jgi:hypothetical protein
MRLYQVMSVKKLSANEEQWVAEVADTSGRDEWPKTQENSAVC